MHELALSQDIVRTVLRAADVPRERITAIALVVGDLSSVNVSSLEFCLEITLQEHDMEGVEVRIEPVPAEARCACGAAYRPETMFAPCPECGGFDREIVGGKDVTIRHMEVEDEQG